MNKYLLVLVVVTSPLAGASDAWASDSQADSNHYLDSPLVRMVRQATEHYKDVRLAEAAGYVPGPCVSGRNGGAMGVHYVNAVYLDDAPPKVGEPEALIYEPLANGQLRLVGVEYITLAGPAVLEGHLLNYTGSANRYGLPEFWELHVWAFKHNPDGAFADWNPDVSCASLPAS